MTVKVPKIKKVNLPDGEPENKTVSDNTVKELDKLIHDLNKKFGDNAISRGIKTTKAEIKRIPTGSISLDIALGGGIPQGRMTEISGGYSTGKTTQLLHIIRGAQKMGLVCALIDVEETTDFDYAKSLGVDVENLLYSNPDSTEEATQLMLDLQKTGTVQFGALDSIASMSPNTEIQKNMDDTMRMGITPNLINEFCRKYQMFNNRLKREGKQTFTLVCLNQLRESPSKYGDPEYAPGGRGKGFTASVDIRFRKGDWISQGTGDNKEIVGQVTKFKIDKNKVGKRMSTGEFDFYFSENSAGVKEGYNDTIKEIIIGAVEWDVIQRVGSWFKYEDQKYQGQESLINALRNDPELVNKLKGQIMYLANKKV